MEDFKGKIIKVTLNSDSGIVVVTGPFIKSVDGFIVLKNPVNKTIEYFSMYFVKSVSIVRDIKDNDLAEK